MNTPTNHSDPRSETALDVLFIDDSPNLCRAMELWLKTSGYSARIALNAAAAEEIASRETPRLVIADIGLPDASGYDLRQRLKEIPGMADTHFIALSGQRDRSVPRHSIEAGFDTFISKPPDFEELASILEECIPHRPGAA
ncbi:MAG TPA: response regulator [Opitutales bacterium]|nr:response regulator [Opitutales bacterium]